MVIVFHRIILYAVEYHVDVIESGFCIFSPLLCIGYTAELLLQAAFFIHETSCGFLIKGVHCFCGYTVEHFSEFCVDLGDLHLKVNAVILASFTLQAHADVQLQHLQHLSVSGCRFHDRRHHSPLQNAFLYGG